VELYDAVALSCEPPSPVPYTISDGFGQLTVGVATPVMVIDHCVNSLVPPDSMSAKYNVHGPEAFNPLKFVNELVRVVVSATLAGSILRPSGCHVPDNGAPAPGVVTF